MDEFFIHQIPEPLPNVAVHHDHWRESLFFVAHPRDSVGGDVVVFTIAHFPKREVMDGIQMGRYGGERGGGYYHRPYDGDPHTLQVGAMRIDIVEPYKTVHFTAGEGASVGVDLTFTARSREYGLRRGTMKAGHEIIWDQSHMVQSGTYNGTYTHDGITYDVEDWWGQRDHSWGIRDHGRCPLWIWPAFQLPDGMFGGWHWEYPNGAHCFTDMCFAPTDLSDPIPVINFAHDVEFVDGDDKPVAFGKHGEDVSGVRGSVAFTLANGDEVRCDVAGPWAAPYEPFRRGGQFNVAIRTGDGREGNGILEVTGARHHRYFPDTDVEGTLPEA
jgi:hypothetical protein